MIYIIVMNYNYNNPYPNQGYVNPQANMYSNNCNMCGGMGYYTNPNGAQIYCQHANIQQTQPMMNPYVKEEIIVRPKHQNIVSRTFRALENCVKCAGRGFTDGYNGNEYCIDCIRESGFCPMCENTGYMLNSGSRCRCGMNNDYCD
jgi:hypothetical protein